VAGVAFSANPLTGNRDEVRVSATRGLGDKLVSGAIDADEWLVTHEDATVIAQPQEAMGPELADDILQGAARGDEFRTSPLWGLGQRIFPTCGQRAQRGPCWNGKIGAGWINAYTPC